MVKIIE